MLGLADPAPAALAIAEAAGSAKPAGELTPLYLPAKALEDAHTPAERLDALVLLHAAKRYERTTHPDATVQLALVWENGDRLTGNGITSSAALGALEQRLAGFVRPS